MDSYEVFLCFSCGTRNRVLLSKRSIANCSKCGEKLFPDKKSAGQRNWSVPTVKWNPFGGLDWILIRRGFFWLAIIAMVVAVPFFADQDDNTPPPEELPPAVFQRPGVIWNFTGRIGVAPFEIRTSPGSNYYIRMYDPATKQAVIGIYANGGQTIEVDIPPGSYNLKYAFGDIWRGEKNLFGPGNLTRFSAAKKQLDFTLSQGYTIELIPQVGGNFPTEPIKRYQF